MNCRPPCMAVIVSMPVPACKHWIGRVVEVLEDGSADAVMGAGWMWLCEGRLDIGWPVLPEHLLPGEVVGKRCFIPDAWLKPLPSEREVMQHDEVIRVPEPQAA